MSVYIISFYVHARYASVFPPRLSLFLFSPFLSLSLSLSLSLFFFFPGIIHLCFGKHGAWAHARTRFRRSWKRHFLCAPGILPMKNLSSVRATRAKPATRIGNGGRLINISLRLTLSSPWFPPTPVFLEKPPDLNSDR